MRVMFFTETAKFQLSIKTVKKLIDLKFWILAYRPGGEGGNGPPEGKFMKLGGKVNFGVLSSKIDVIRAKGGHQPRFDK